MKNQSKVPMVESLMKVQFCVPPLGTKIVLAEPWSFDLYNERRNEKLIDTLGLRKLVTGPTEKKKDTRYGIYDYATKSYIMEDYEYDYTPTHYEWEGGKDIPYREVIKKVTLPRGSKLTVSRIYIRNGVKDYDSITFHLIKGRKKKNDPVPPHGRFWAKLHDVNRIVCYPVGSDPDVNAIWVPAERNHLSTFRFLDINDPLD